MKRLLVVLLAALSFGCGPIVKAEWNPPGSASPDSFVVLDEPDSERRYIQYQESDIPKMSAECARACLAMNFYQWNGATKPAGWDEHFETAWAACPELRGTGAGFTFAR